MPEYSSNSGSAGMDPNYSDDAGGDTPAEPKGEEQESPRGLLPKAILMGKDFKPGDEIVLKIEAIHDDEVEVSYAPEKKEGSKEEEAGESPRQEAQETGGGMGGSSMASMME